MAFNKNTWTKDYSSALGLKLLAARDAVRKGYAPKHARKGARPVRGASASPKGEASEE